jgi:hypothetical protein
MTIRIASQRPATRVPRKRPIRRVLPRILGAVLLTASVFTYAGFRQDLSAARSQLAGIPTEVYASPWRVLQ